MNNEILFWLVVRPHQFPYEMVMSQKGKNQLKYRGHFYVQEKKTPIKTYWV